MKINSDKGLMHLGVRRFKNIITKENFNKFKLTPNSINYDGNNYVGASLVSIPKDAKYVVIPEGITIRGTVKALNKVTLKGTLAEGAKIIAPKYESAQTTVAKGKINASHSAYLNGKYKGAIVRSTDILIAPNAEIIKCEIFAPMAKRKYDDRISLGGGTVGAGGKIIDTNISAMGNVHFMPDAHMKRGSLRTRNELFIWGRMDETSLAADKGITVYNIAKVNNCTMKPGTIVANEKVEKPLSRKETAKKEYLAKKTAEKGHGGKKTHKQQTPHKHKPKDILVPIFARYVAQIKKMRKKAESYFKTANKAVQKGKKAKVAEKVC